MAAFDQEKTTIVVLGAMDEALLLAGNSQNLFDLRLQLLRKSRVWDGSHGYGDWMPIWLDGFQYELYTAKCSWGKVYVRLF